MRRRLLPILALILIGATGASFALAPDDGPCSGDMVGHAIFTAPEHPEFDLVAGDTPESAVAKFLSLVESKDSVDPRQLTAVKVHDTTYVVSGGKIRMGVSQIGGRFVVTTSLFCAEDNVPDLYSNQP